MEKVSAMKKVALFMRTKRVARPMKFAAFISIIISVAVIFAACQGAVGPRGPKGADGADGADGVDGEQGSAAPLSLTGRTGPVLLDSLNAGDDENEATEFVVDLTDGYFNGGEAPYKFTATVSAENPDNTENLTAEIDEDTNMLKIELTFTDGTTTYTADEYMNGYTVALSAVDANDESANSLITIKPNRAPVTAEGVAAPDDGGAITGANATLTIGTQAGEVDADDSADDNQPRDSGVAECSMYNQCELALFADEGDVEVSVTSEASDKFSWTAKGDTLTLTGLVSTMGETADEPVEVEVTAVDGDELSLALTFMLSVNAPPTLSELADDVTTDVKFTLGTASNLITPTAAAALFEDPEKDMVAASFSSSNESIVMITEQGAVTPVSRGRATITVTGKTGADSGTTGDGLGQSAKIEYSVTVE